MEPGRASLELSGPLSTEIIPATTTIFFPEQTGLPVEYYQHQADFQVWSPGSEHAYRVLIDGYDAAVSPGELRFRSPAAGPFRVLVFGDSGWDSASQAQIAALMLREQPDFALVTGDLGYPVGSYAYYESNYFDYYAPLLKSIPFFPCPGNHDYYGDVLQSYLATNAVPESGVPESDRGRYYSFDWGNAHFVSLDSMKSLFEAVETGGLMLEWVENDLAQTRKFWRIVFFHHPPFAAGPNENDPMCVLARERIVPLLERHGVQLVLSGHEHSYQRTESLLGGYVVGPDEGTTYITTGGGGSILYPVFASHRLAAGASVYHYLRVENQGPRMLIQSIREDGGVIDTLMLAPRPALYAHLIVDDWIQLLGNHLAAEDAVAFAEPLPVELAGTSVFFAGTPLPLRCVSNGEIWARLPYAPYPGSWITVTTPNGAAEFPIG
jgi:predicted MPP superfamily phosphohydrolase